MNNKEGVTNVRETDNLLVSTDILNSFHLRILEKIICLSTRLTPTVSVWDEPINMGQRIEQDPLSLDTVVKEAMKDKTYFFPSATENPRHYHAILCRVYILLYYLHHGKKDEGLYEKRIFPTLIDNMGVYGSKYLETIIKEINEVLEYEQLVREPKSEEKTHPLNPAQARAFCEGLLEQLGCKDIKLKTHIAPLANVLFGWSLSTMERTHSYEQADRDYIAKPFENIAPSFYAILKNIGKKEQKAEHIDKSKKAGLQNKEE